MRIDILTLFPAMFTGPLTESILQRASLLRTDGESVANIHDDKPLQIVLHDLRAFGAGRYRQVDDKPYGGGAGMVLKVDVVVPAMEAIIACSKGKPHCISFSPRGKRLTQPRVERIARKYDRLLLLCGHYEGIDQRVLDGGWVDEEVSIGDYVLTGGELPAMVLIDAVARQIPGVLGKEESSQQESFSRALHRKREYPHYTRPEEFRNLRVPDVLLSGHHADIERWRRSQLY